MSLLIPIMLWGWIPICLALFAVYRPHTAVLIGVIGGFLFLPIAGYSFSGLPEYTKTTAISLGVLLAAMIHDPVRLRAAMRLHWFDLPMLILLVAPLAASISNEIGGGLFSSIYGSFGATASAVFDWGIPYLLGRAYFSHSSTMKKLAVALVIGGLVYVPLCLIEVRLSPQLHRWVYGFHARSFAETFRLGGFRPTVFMYHGLALGMFMTIVTLTAFWMWMAGTVRRVWFVSIGAATIVLAGTAVLCKSSGALALLAMGMAAAYLTKITRIKALLLVMVLLPPLYMTVRIADLWKGEGALELCAALFGEERAGSWNGRMTNEDMFTDKAMLRPFFGWSGWNRFQVYADNGQILTTPDGYWVILLGTSGLFGLTGFTALLLLPAVLLIRRLPAATWYRPEGAPVAAMAMMLVLFMLDSLLNAMPSPIYPLAAGGLLQLLGAPGEVPAEQPIRSIAARPARKPPLAAHAGDIQ